MNYPVVNVNTANTVNTKIASCLQSLPMLNYPVGSLEDYRASVFAFQRKFNLTPDGIVGEKTWAELIYQSHGAISKLGIEDCLLPPGEYIPENTVKTHIVLHHTVSGGNPVNVIKNAWSNDRSSQGGKLPVATAFLIGNAMWSENGRTLIDNTKNGQIVRAFPEKNWAYALGASSQIERLAIQVEICSYGYLSKDGNGYKNVYGTYVNDSEVQHYPKLFRNQPFYHKYSDQQIEALRKLLMAIHTDYGIPIRTNYSVASFDYVSPGSSAINHPLANKPGVYFHTNFRTDKSDLHPQPELLAMLNSL